MPNNDQIRRPTHSDAEAQPDSGSRSAGAGNAEPGGLEVIDEDELQTMLDDNQKSGSTGASSDVTPEPPAADAGSDLNELSLVSTQALQKLLVGDEKKPEPKPDENAGFNPYDKNDGTDDPEE